MSLAVDTQEAFSAELESIRNRCSDLVALLPSGGGRAGLCNFVFEQSLLNACVSWEHFAHNIFVAHIVDNPARLFSTYEAKVRDSIRDRYGSRISEKVHLRKRKKLGRLHAEDILDPKGFNLVFRKAADLGNRANELMQPSIAQKFALVPEDIELIDLVLSIRNYLSHSSASATTTMRETIGAIDSEGPNGSLSGKVGSVGVYLKTQVGGVTRFDCIIDRISDISSKLV